MASPSGSPAKKTACVSAGLQTTERSLMFERNVKGIRICTAASSWRSFLFPVEPVKPKKAARMALQGARRQFGL
ncbi:hypothetical protein [Pararhizobium sp. PWRC1-1]|uniref:hypothetical protein n=1 Tax=Pararhizobium sp. PWRC1-1 TaxID=2804566 RepID=UPI003CFA52FE